MKEITTKDDSVTFFNEEYRETYHSVTGAVEEVLKKFVYPAGIAELAKARISILDVCFGLGYNSCAAIDVAKAVNPNCKMRIVALEKDEALKEAVATLTTPFSHYHLIREAYRSNYCVEEKTEIRLIFGNAEERVKELHERFDVVFLDPFSRNHELWAEGFLKELCRVMKKGSRLTTYSCARSVRDNLSKAGFEVIDGPRIGRRGPSTVAIK